LATEPDSGSNAVDWPAASCQAISEARKASRKPSRWPLGRQHKGQRQGANHTAESRREARLDCMVSRNFLGVPDRKCCQRVTAAGIRDGFRHVPPQAPPALSPDADCGRSHASRAACASWVMLCGCIGGRNARRTFAIDCRLTILPATLNRADRCRAPSSCRMLPNWFPKSHPRSATP